MAIQGGTGHVFSPGGCERAGNCEYFYEGLRLVSKDARSGENYGLGLHLLGAGSQRSRQNIFCKKNLGSEAGNCQLFL